MPEGWAVSHQATFAGHLTASTATSTGQGLRALTGRLSRSCGQSSAKRQEPDPPPLATGRVVEGRRGIGRVSCVAFQHIGVAGRPFDLIRSRDSNSAIDGQRLAGIVEPLRRFQSVLLRGECFPINPICSSVGVRAGHNVAVHGFVFDGAHCFFSLSCELGGQQALAGAGEAFTSGHDGNVASITAGATVDFVSHLGVIGIVSGGNLEGFGGHAEVESAAVECVKVVHGFDPVRPVLDCPPPMTDHSKFYVGRKRKIAILAKNVRAA